MSYGSVLSAAVIGVVTGGLFEHYVSSFLVFLDLTLILPIAFVLLSIGILGVLGQRPIAWGSLSWFLTGFGVGAFAGGYNWPPPPITE
jgi:hypothetical protein